MSGICGILRLDGGSPEGIEAMAERLQRRGPEGTHIFRDGPCALGHTLLATTPEALVERQPFTHTETGCTITADLRLDNRDDLMPALSLAGQGRVIGDAEIVLYAYLKWGEDCAAHLLGDFAFAIWDPRYRCLFCARDQVGMKQFIYAHMEGRVFAFASQPTATVMADDIPVQINEGRIADFLERYLEGIDLTSTFFEGVFRLPPAHFLKVDKNAFILRRYWILEPCRNLNLSNDQEYADAFLDKLKTAVCRRLRAPSGTVGSMLSGGMDSGSIVAIASQYYSAQNLGRFPTFSAISPDIRDCVETRTIQEALKMRNLNAHLVNWSQITKWKSEIKQSKDNAEEPFGDADSMLRSLYLHASRSGVKVLLDGSAGDVVCSYDDRVAWLLRQGHTWAAWTAAMNESVFFGGNLTPFRAFRSGLRTSLGFLTIRKIRALLREFRGDVRVRPFIHPAFAQRIDLAARIRLSMENEPGRFPDVSTQRLVGMTGPNLVAGKESYERIASYFAIEPRDPFADVELLRFALGVPESQLIRGIWPKWVLRNATLGLLPDGVRSRRGKQHLGPEFQIAYAATVEEDQASVINKEILEWISEEHVFSSDCNKKGPCGNALSGVALALNEWLTLLRDLRLLK